MAKQKKKRNKPYRGSDAANVRPSIIRVDAVKRNKLQLWWNDNKRLYKPVAIAVLVVIVIVMLVIELFRAASL